MARCVCVFALLAGSSVGYAQTAQFIALGDLPGGGFSSIATAVSADGTTVVGWSDIEPFHHAFRWTAAEGMVDLGVIDDSVISRAYGVSGDGSVVVGEVGGSFRWTAETGMEFVSGELNARGSNAAYAVSADGGTIVGMSQKHEPPETQAFRHSGGEDDLLGHIPCGDAWSMAYAVSADGRVIVGEDFSCGYQAIVWTAESGLRAIGFPDEWKSTHALGISGDGRVIVGVGLKKGEGFLAYRYDDSGLEVLGDLPGGDVHSSANAASANGSAIVGDSEGDLGEDEAFSGPRRTGCGRCVRSWMRAGLPRTRAGCSARRGGSRRMAW